jgi:hypothetical protein
MHCSIVAVNAKKWWLQDSDHQPNAFSAAIRHIMQIGFCGRCLEWFGAGAVVSHFAAKPWQFAGDAAALWSS